MSVWLPARCSAGREKGLFQACCCCGFPRFAVVEPNMAALCRLPRWGSAEPFVEKREAPRQLAGRMKALPALPSLHRISQSNSMQTAAAR